MAVDNSLVLTPKGEMEDKMSPAVEVENAQVYIEKLDGDSDVDGKRDYAGAVAKSDPAEIALVRKLDWRLMPTLWAMYFL